MPERDTGVVIGGEGGRQTIRRVSQDPGPSIAHALVALGRVAGQIRIEGIVDEGAGQDGRHLADVGRDRQPHAAHEVLGGSVPQVDASMGRRIVSRPDLDQGPARQVALRRALAAQELDDAPHHCLRGGAIRAGHVLENRGDGALDAPGCDRGKEPVTVALHEPFRVADALSLQLPISFRTARPSAAGSRSIQVGGGGGGSALGFDFVPSRFAPLAGVGKGGSSDRAADDRPRTALSVEYGPWMSSCPTVRLLQSTRNQPTSAWRTVNLSSPVR